MVQHLLQLLRPALRLSVFTAAVCLGSLWHAGDLRAERPPFTKNVPVWEFQNSGKAQPYDYDAPPKGIFHTIQFSEGFEEEVGLRRGHQMVAVSPTDQFHPDTRVVFIVFQLHQHYLSMQVTALCYPEAVQGMNPMELVTEDAMELTTEDASGYLQLFPPTSGWKPGRYKVEIHVGWEINDISLMGTMRFDVVG
ncbi:MAG: hypothetical protein V3R16_07175 [Nitrospirales bacterium]